MTWITNSIAHESQYTNIRMHGGYNNVYDILYGNTKHNQVESCKTSKTNSDKVELPCEIGKMLKYLVRAELKYKEKVKNDPNRMYIIDSNQVNIRYLKNLIKDMMEFISKLIKELQTIQNSFDEITERQLSFIISKLLMPNNESDAKNLKTKMDEAKDDDKLRVVKAGLIIASIIAFHAIHIIAPYAVLATLFISAVFTIISNYTKDMYKSIGITKEGNNKEGINIEIFINTLDKVRGCNIPNTDDCLAKLPGLSKSNPFSTAGVTSDETNPYTLMNFYHNLVQQPDKIPIANLCFSSVNEDCEKEENLEKELKRCYQKYDTAQNQGKRTGYVNLDAVTTKEDCQNLADTKKTLQYHKRICKAIFSKFSEDIMQEENDLKEKENKLKISFGEKMNKRKEAIGLLTGLAMHIGHVGI